MKKNSSKATLESVSKNVDVLTKAVIGLTKNVDILTKNVDSLTETVDKLAESTARGFASIEERMVTKEDLKEYATRNEMETMMSKHIRGFRNDYDHLASRVKRLETAMFHK